MVWEEFNKFLLHVPSANVRDPKIPDFNGHHFVLCHAEAIIETFGEPCADSCTLPAYVSWMTCNLLAENKDLLARNEDHCCIMVGV